MGSGLVFSPLTPSEESFFVPLVGGEHEGAVVDAENRHLVGVIQVLQQLVVNPAPPPKKNQKQKFRRLKKQRATGERQQGCFLRV